MPVLHEKITGLQTHTQTGTKDKDTKHGKFDPWPASNPLPGKNTRTLRKTAVFMRMMGQSADDLNNIKTQCTAPALQLMLLGEGLLGRTVPERIENDSGTPVVSNYQLLAHQHMTNEVI